MQNFLLAVLMQNAITGVFQAIGKTSLVTWCDDSSFNSSFAKRTLISLNLIGEKLDLMQPAFHHMHWLTSIIGIQTVFS